MPRYIAYIRVSTRKQQASGLGLEAQQDTIAQFVAQSGGEVLAEYREVESGKHDDRPELGKALKHCRLTGATLIVAKLDRLSRNVAFLMTLRDSNVQFTCVDLPSANTLTVAVMAAMAQHERELISARTKAALKAAKARGVRLGGIREGNGFVGSVAHLGTQQRQAKADSFANDLKDHIDDMKGMSLAAMARELMQRGIKTPRGGTEWTAKGVSRVIDRL